MIANSSFTRHLAIIFVGLLDGVAYMLLSLSYRIFLAICELDLFGGSSAGQTIYDVFTQKIYMILSVVMIFVFAYELILMIINPDGDGVKTTSYLLKDVVISIALVAVLPTVFKYMQVFQIHVIQNNTIGAIVLGTSPTASGKSEESYGDTISMVMLMAFYHPQGGGYDDFFDTQGNFKERDAAISSCTSHGQASDTTCGYWYDALEKFWFKIQNNSSLDGGGVFSVTWNSNLRKTIGDDDGSYYMWVISTGCALMAAWFFISYAIDIGTRAVKLGFLELIAPIPVMLRIVPKMEKSFKTWQGEIIKTYVELFIRVAVIFLIAKLCTLVPQFIDVIFSGDDYVNAGLLLKGITAVVLILGLLKFAKEAPELFKSIMDNGGNLFKGINFKPGAGKRIQENDYAMRALSTGVGGISGMVGNVAKRFQQSRTNADGTERQTSRFGSILTSLTAAPRGVISGAKSGWKNTAKTLSRAEFGKIRDSAYEDAHASLEKAYNGPLRSRYRNEFRDIVDSDVTNAESGFQELKDIHTRNKRAYELDRNDRKTLHDQRKTATKEERRNRRAGIGEVMSNEQREFNQELLNSINTQNEIYKNIADKTLEAWKKAKDDDMKKIFSGQSVVKVTYDEQGNEQKRYLRDINEVKKYWDEEKANEKYQTVGGKLSQQMMNSMLMTMQNYGKQFSNKKMDQKLMDDINEKAKKFASKNNFTVDGKTIQTYDDLVKYASRDEARTNAITYAKMIDMMDDVQKSVKEANDINKNAMATANLMKNAQKEDKK